MTHNFIINTNDQLLIVDHLYSIDGYITFNITVHSGEFKGTSNFCISPENAATLIKNLSLMNKTLKGSCIIKDYDSDAFIFIEFINHGQLFISGQIGGNHQDHMMKFKYQNDQTMLRLLLETIKRESENAQ